MDTVSTYKNCPKLLRKVPTWDSFVAEVVVCLFADKGGSKRGMNPTGDAADAMQYKE